MIKNILTSMSEPNPGPFTWLNGSCYTCLPGGGIRITAHPKSDFFRDPAGIMVADSAAYLHLAVTGDFVAQARVRHPFRTQWDAAVLMARVDPAHWAKICYEGTDFGTHAIVSVVTNGVSDDANGVNTHWTEVWLQMVRKGNTFGLQYGPDGVQWNMVRFFSLDAPATIQVGMVAQSPIGPGSEMDFLHFGVENMTVQEARNGL